MSKRNIKEEIIGEFIKQFNAVGCKVNLDVLASNIHISKKTIYQYFDSKLDIYNYILKESEEVIHAKQISIFNDDKLSTKEKLIQILTIQAPRETEIDISKLYSTKKYEPKFYDNLINSFGKSWDYIVALIEKGKEEKIVKNISSTFVISLLQVGMEMLMKDDFLSKNKITYTEGIVLLANIVLYGISEV